MTNKFMRLPGVREEIFEKMLKVLEEKEGSKASKAVRKRKLSLREYRTYIFSYRKQLWDPDFALPGKKALLKSDMEYEVIMIDATETPVERPKKNKRNIIQARKNDKWETA